MIVVVFAVILAALTSIIYWLGSSATADTCVRVQEIQAEADRGVRQMHELTRQAFIAIADEAAQRRLPGT